MKKRSQEQGTSWRDKLVSSLILPLKVHDALRCDVFFTHLFLSKFCTVYYLFVSMFLDVEARAARPPLLLSQGAASLHDRRAARVAVAISRARERLLG